MSQVEFPCKYSIKISQKDETYGYSDSIIGEVESYVDAKVLLNIALKAFPRSTVTISMIECESNMPDAEPEEEVKEV